MRDEKPAMAELVQAAAEWRTRQDAGLTPSESVELDRWLEANPLHRQLFSEMEATWQLLDRVVELPGEAVATPSREPRSEKIVAPPRSRPALFAGWAAAAALAVWLGWKALSIPASAPAVAMAQEEDFHQTVTATSAPRRMDLSDGSVLRLNAGATAEISYGAAERSIRLLQGEAAFEVAKNPARPFVVAAGGIAVKAVGTVFDVNLKSHSVEVLVTEGKVTVAPTEAGGQSPGTAATPAPLALVEPGQRLVLGLQPGSRPRSTSLAPSDVALALGWQQRRLEFDATPLEQILAEFNRCNVHPLLIAPDSPELASLRLSGSFRADEPRTFIELLRTRGNISVETQADRTTLHLVR